MKVVLLTTSWCTILVVCTTASCITAWILQAATGETTEDETTFVEHSAVRTTVGFESLVQIHCEQLRMI